jgi:ABC-type lipoprotein release transport system permease subunit
MLRLILGVILGLLTGVVVTATVEGVGHTIFPPPPGVNLTDPATLKTVMSQIPLEAKVAVLLAWFLGVLFGASTANLIAGRRALAGRIVATALFAFSVWTMATIPHPAWFVASAVMAAILAAFAADRAFGRRRI